MASSPHRRESLVEAALRAALPVVMLVCAAGCASPRPPPPAPAPAAEAPALPAGRLGTIVAVRPLSGRAASGAEFVVREDSGAAVVVIQSRADGLAVGDRVALHDEGRVRLTRAP